MAGINDTNASAIGAGAVREFDGVIYIGTSLVLTCHLPFKKTDLFHLMTSMPSPVRSRYLLMAEQGTGGKSLEFFLRSIVYADDGFATGPVPDDVYERVNHIAAKVPAGSEGVLFLPWLNGTLAPEENATARGSFFNLSLSSTRSHMTRALLEGIAYNNRWTVGPAEKFIGRKFDHFRFAGGGALSDVWAQIHADVLGVPIHQVANPTHVTTRGAAFLAFDKLGVRSLGELKDRVQIRRVFEPDESNRALYDKMYAQFRALYKRNKKVFAALNQE
jgi:xylulokinase